MQTRRRRSTRLHAASMRRGHVQGRCYATGGTRRPWVAPLGEGWTHSYPAEAVPLMCTPALCRLEQSSAPHLTRAAIERTSSLPVTIFPQVEPQRASAPAQSLHPLCFQKHPSRPAGYVRLYTRDAPPVLGKGDLDYLQFSHRYRTALIYNHNQRFFVTK